MGSLNIKNSETFRLANELARATGRSVTGAVTASLRESLERTKLNSSGDVYARWKNWIHENSWRLKEPYRSIDHGDLLYDEKGLPK